MGQHVARREEYLRHLAEGHRHPTSHDHYDVAGPREGRVILFVHGSGRTREMWLPQMQALADSFRVIAIDLPGHGAFADHDFRLETATAEIAQILRQESTDPANPAHEPRALIVGLSLGGYVSMAFADAYREQTVGLVLAGCSVGFHGLLGVLTKISAFLYVLAMRFGGKRLLPWLKRRERQALRGRLPKPFAEPQLEAGLYLGVWGRTMFEVVDRNYREMLREYPKPVLILNGEHDTWNRKTEHAQDRAAQHSRVQTIPRAGHMSNVQNPAAFTRAVRSFADTLCW